MREMILAETEEERQTALDTLFEYQKARFRLARVAVGLCRSASHCVVLRTTTDTTTSPSTPLHPHVYTQEDMRAMFEAMTGKHVTIRLLDPPLHEFLPNVRTNTGALYRIALLSLVGVPCQCYSHRPTPTQPTQTTQNHEDTAALAKRINKPVEVVRHEIEELKEANPMLGFRGW